MNREIKFRGKGYYGWFYGYIQEYHEKYGKRICVCPVSIRTWKDALMYEVKEETIGQFTGLHDKSGNACIFEGDILSLHGTLIGNKYENEDLLKDRTNLLIDGLCTKEWVSTYQEAIKRGCINAK